MHKGFGVLNKNLTKCRGCNSSSLEQIYFLKSMPLAGDFLRNSSDEAIGYDIEVAFCKSCSLIQIVDPINPEILFTDYSFSSSTVKPLVDHFAGFADELIANLRPESVFEICCNDGIFQFS